MYNFVPKKVFMQAKFYLSIFIGVATLTMACDKDEVYHNKTNKYTGAIIQFDTVTTLYSEDAKIKIKIQAPTQQVFDNNNVLYPNGLQINMYNELGEKTTVMVADTGKYDYATQHYTGIGNVKVTNLTQRQTLYTDEITWQQNRREIFTEKPIKIITEKEQLTGVGLISNEEFSQYTIKKPTGVFSLEENQQPKQ
jgi:LPS export ABC transporter protein LptC